MNKANLKSEKKFEFYSGQIAMGEGYGMIPFTYQNNPLYYFSSNGSIGMRFGILPFQIQYGYTGIKNSSAASNYTRISFDVSEFRKNQVELYKKKKDSLDTKLNSLLKLKQEISQKKLEIAYQLNPPEILSQYPTIKDSPGKQLVNVQGMSDSLSTEKVDTELDNDGIDLTHDTVKASNDTSKLSIDTTEYWSSKKVKGVRQSVSQVNYNEDSLQGRFRTYSDSLQYIDSQINKIARIKAYYQSASLAGNFILKPKLSFSFKEALHGVKRFEIGQCNPDYSHYLISSVLFNGIYAEGEVRNIYWALAFGKTTVRFVSNYAKREKYFQFSQISDVIKFSDVSTGRRIFSLKAGFGKKEESHFYVGGLWGYGHIKEYYIHPLPEYSKLFERNQVCEIDGKINLTHQLGAEFIYAISSLKYVNESNDLSELVQPDNSKRNILHSAATALIHYDLAKIHLKLNGQVKLTGPFFKSFGVGYSSTDNLSYQVRINKTFSSLEQVNLNYSEVRSNLSNLLLYSNIVRSFGISNILKLTKSFSWKADFQPTFIQSTIPDTLDVKSRNMVFNNVFTFNPQREKSPFTSSLIYSFNEFRSEKYGSTYSSVNLNMTFSINKKYTIGNSNLFSQQVSKFKAEYNYRSMSEELMFAIVWSEKIKSSIKVRYSSTSFNSDIGLDLRVNYRIAKYLDVSMSGSKYNQVEVLGRRNDNSMVFPYDLLLQLKFNW